MTEYKGTPVALNRKHLTKAEKAIRQGVEDTLKGEELDSRPPQYLTKEQKKIYKWLVEKLKVTNVLSILDKHTVSQASIIMERLNAVDAQINTLIASGQFDKDLEAIRKSYFSQYLQVCKELCLSPASRGRMGALACNAKKDQKDDLIKALNGD